MKASLASVDFEYALLCEDVRQEGTGKFIVIGMYANSILLSAFPARLRLRLLTRMHPKVRTFPLAFRFLVNDEPAIVLRGNIVDSDLEADTSPTPEMMVNFAEPGSFKVEVSDDQFEMEEADNASWTPLFSIPVQINES